MYKVRLADGSLLKAATPNLASAIDSRISVGAKVWLWWPDGAAILLKS
jgi:hypothetical protein